MTERGDRTRVVHPLYHAEDGGSIPTSPLQLFVHRILFDKAKELNAKWHSRLPRIGDPDNIMRNVPCFAATYEGTIYAVAIWSHPVARALPQDDWLELRRLAIAPSLQTRQGIRPVEFCR